MNINTVIEEAFSKPIEDGRARILLRLEFIECEVENSAPDFISVEDDELFLSVQPSNEVDVSIEALNQTFPVKYVRNKDEGNGVVLKMEQPSIWFDIDVEQVTDIWIADLSFRIENKNSRYLAYYITALDHQLEWLQPELRSGEIQSMSISTKKFKPPKITGKESFSSTEVIRCADMIGRSIRKIDLRTGGAYVKFNTDKGRLEPLIIGIAEKLGYVIEPLDKETIVQLDQEGKNVSHAIYLKQL
ncbi:MAG: hypothetical protein JJ895_08590 [Balneolaceae bacterium]|nr:hypothetical protein [Balneolaceae bacterium]